MFFICGHRLFGKIDHVPGVLFVATQFYHINYLPLFPTNSCIVRAEDGLSVSIGLNYRSLLMAYARMGLLGLAVVFAISTLVAALQGSSNVFLFAGACLPSAFAWTLLNKHPTCCIATFDRALEWAERAGVSSSARARLHRFYESAEPIAPTAPAIFPAATDPIREPAVFFITGKQRDNGQDVCVTVWAQDADQADQIGRARGVDVTKVEPTRFARR
ncbi:MAG TPA: hypothetical protein VHY37_00970 [Tepidisphaeraceae bacterium]|jgi:hypothetical protein|nr:hypothetical protein [Tepidisphaeraceae bacterium]